MRTQCHVCHLYFWSRKHVHRIARSLAVFQRATSECITSSLVFVVGNYVAYNGSRSYISNACYMYMNVPRVCYSLTQAFYRRLTSARALLGCMNTYIKTYYINSIYTFLEALFLPKLLPPSPPSSYKFVIQHAIKCAHVGPRRCCPGLINRNYEAARARICRAGHLSNRRTVSMCLRVRACGCIHVWVPEKPTIHVNMLSLT